MGEAKRKQESHRELLERCPICIYCGGHADTIEHMPPRMLFKGRQRPNELVFPACYDCNHGTRDSDLVASLFARLYPEMRDDEDRTEVNTLFNALRNNIPNLLSELKIGSGGQKLARKLAPSFVPPHLKFVRADGPILKRHMLIFAAKLGFSLYFEAAGRSLAKEGGVRPVWFTNVQALRGEIPEDLVKLLPAPETLKQGKHHVRDQFEYSPRIDEQLGGYLARFRLSFFAAGIVAKDASDLGEDTADWPIFRPGAFRRSVL